MSEVIDSKVVELKFNNAEFEKNVKTSLTTIEKLKKSLNFDTVTTSMNLLQNAFQLKGLKNIQTQLGQVVGAVDKSVSPIMATINSIGDAITNTIGGAISGVVAQIKSGGMNRAMNVEKAKFALQGLKIEWDDVKDSISDAVTGTAYGMDAAARAASVLAGSGIDYKKVIGKDLVDTDVELTQMGMVLKSISGVATQTNQDFEQMAHIFSTIAGNGRLMGMQLSQLSQYGMNAAADIGDAIGKTDAEVRDLVSKGKIGADQFFEIMYKKYWANAKKANDTLDGVSRNIRATYSRIGEAFYGPLIANQGPVVKMLGAYKDVIGLVASRLKAPGTKLKDGEGNKLTTFVTKWLIKDVNLVTKFLTDIKNNGDVMKAWRAVYRVLKSGFKIFQMTFNFARSIGQAIKEAFPESFLDYWIDINTHIFNFVNIFYKGSKKIKKNAETMSKAFKGIRGVLEPIYKNVQNLTDAFKQFFDETFDGIDPLETVVNAISDLCGYLHAGIVETEDWRKGFDALWGIVKHVYGVFKAFGEAVYETFKEGHFHPIKFIIDLLHTLTDGIVSNDKKTDKLKNTFKIFTTIIGVVAKVFGAALLIVAKVFNILFKIGGWVLNITSPIGTLVSKIFELVTGFTDAAKNIDLDKYENLKKVIEGVKDFFGKAKDAVEKFSEKVSDFAENHISKIKVDWPEAFGKVLDVLDKIVDKAGKVKNKITNGVGKAIDNLKTSIDNTFGSDSQTKMSSSKDILEKISKIDILGGIGKGIKTLGKAIKKVFDYLGDSPLISQIGKDLKDFFKNTTGSIKDDLNMKNGKSAMDSVVGIFETFGEGLGKIFKVIGYILKSFTDSVLKYGSSEDMQKTAELILDFFTTLTVFNWSRSIRNLTRAVKGFEKGHILEKWKKTFNALAGTFESIGKSMLMIAASLYIISTIDEKRLSDSMAIIVWFMIIIGVIGVVFTKTSKTLGGWSAWTNKASKGLHKAEYEVDKMRKVMISIALSLILFAVALKIMDGIKTDDMKANAVVLGIALVVMAGVSYVIAKNANKLEGKDQQFFKYGALIKSMAKAILIIAAALYVIGLIPTDKLDKAVGSLTLIIGAVSVMIVAMVHFSKLFSQVSKGAYEVPATMAACTAIFIAVGIFSVMIAKSLAMIALIPTKMLWKGSAVLLTLIAVVSLFVIAMQGTAGVLEIGKTGALNMASCALAIISMAAACLIFAAAMAAFIPIPWSAIGKGLAVVGAALIGIVAVGMVASKAVVGILSLSAALIAIGVAFALLAASLAIIVKTGPAAVLALATIFYGIGKAIVNLIKGIADHVGEILDAIGDTIDAVFKYLDDNIDTICAKLTEYLAKLVIYAGKIIIAVGKSIGKLIVDGIKEVFSGSGTDLAEALEPELTKLNKSWEEAVKSRDTLFKSAGTDYTKAMDEIKELDKYVGVGGAIYDGYEERVGYITKDLSDATGVEIEIIDGVIQKYDEYKQAILDAIETKKAEALLNADEEAYQEAIQNREKITQELANNRDIYEEHVQEVKDIQKEIADLEWSINPENKDKVAIEGQEQYDVIEDQIEELRKKESQAQEELGAVQKTFMEAQQNFDKMNTTIYNHQNVIGALATGDVDKIKEATLRMEKGYADAGQVSKEYLRKQNEDANKYYESVKKMHKEGVEGVTAQSVTDAYEYAKKTQEAYDKAIHTSEAELQAEAEQIEAQYSPEKIAQITKQTMAAQAKTRMEAAGLTPEQIESQLNGNFTESGFVLSGDLTTSFDDTLKDYDLEGTIKDSVIPQIATDGNIDAASLSGEILGNSTMDGMAKAFQEYDITNVAKAAKDNVLTTFTGKQVFDINSPSKVMMKRVGAPIMEGLAKGISKNVDMVKNPIATVRDTVVNAFNSMVLDSDYQPTITPVVDLSNVNSAAGSINGLFGNQSIGLSSNIGAVSASMREIQNTDKNAGLIAAINGLNGTTNNNVYNVNGITYDDGSNIADAVGQLINAAMIERRM